MKNTFKENGTPTKTKYYAPGYEKEVTSSGTRELYYVNCPYGLVAINIRKNGADSTYYVDSDHLGSILALIRNNGSQAAEYSYDEWGRRRRPLNWNLYDSIPNLGFIDRGFTGHEHYDQFGFIDMNGRVYDPIIGRFLSPDPVIQAPDYTQNYNAYSYCLNNPFKFIDKNGLSYSCITSTLVDENGEVIFAQDDGDNNIYMSHSEEDRANYIKGGASRNNLDRVGWTNDPAAFVGHTGTNIYSHEGNSLISESGGWIISRDREKVQIFLCGPEKKVIIGPYLDRVGKSAEEASKISRKYASSIKDLEIIDINGKVVLEKIWAITGVISVFYSGISEIVAMSNNKETPEEGIFNFTIDVGAIYGGWYGLAVKYIGIPSWEIYSKTILEHPDWTPYYIRGFNH